MIKSIMVASSTNGVIGKDNQLPWHLPNDLKHFKKVTMSKPIIMGRKTFDSIGRPLPGRPNIVLTRDNSWKKEGVYTASSLEEAYEIADNVRREANEVVIIGGEQIYKAALLDVDVIYLTKVHAKVEGDAFFPSINWRQWKEDASFFQSFRAESKDQFGYSFRKFNRIKK